MRRASCALPLFCLAAGALAAGSPNGERFVRFGHDRTDTAPVFLGSAAPDPVDAASSEAFLRQVEALESDFGPYAQGLDEPLGSLGRHYIALGEPGKALAVFNRAMHVVRVNEGLDSRRQLPLLRAALDTYRLTGDHAALDERFDYYYAMFGSGGPPYTDQRLDVALAYLRWQREALRLRLDNQYDRRLLNLLRHNDDLVEAVAGDDSLAPRWQAELALSQLKNYYLLQELVDEPEPVYPSRFDSRLGSPFAEPGRDRPHNPVLEELERRRGAARRLGAAALDDALLRLPQDADPVLRAQLLLALGDWYQWHGDQRSAAQHYSRTVITLTDAGRADLLHQWLGEPVELPDNGVFFQPVIGESVPREHSVLLRYDVSARGRASNISLVQEAGEELESDAQRIQRRLRGTRFRPRWAGGRAEAVAEITRRYVWLH